MAFPQSVLGAQLEMQINGTWTQVVRYDANTKLLNDSAIKITRGIGGLQDRTPPSTCEWTWEDPNGIFSNENPRSPYYGVLPRNTPVRAYVPRSQAALYRRAGATGDGTCDGVACSTPDSAALSISGNMDIRIEFEPILWSRFGIRATPTGNYNSSWVLCSKYAITPNRGWYIRVLETGAIGMGFSTTGTNQGTFASSVPMDLSKPRTALRVTFNTDNGSGNSEARFYQADSIAGPWVEFGVPGLNTAGVTQFDNNAPIELGSLQGGAVTTASAQFYGLRGRIYAFQLYNGINGTLVASPDFTGKTNGTTSFNDAQGNTWTIGPAGEITNAEYRFHGEFSAPVLDPKKSKNGTGVDVKISGEAGGIIRRLQVNDTPLQSPLRRLLTSATYNGAGGASTNGYWHGEDASAADTASASAGISGVNPAILSDVTFNGFDATLPGSAGVMVCGSTAPVFFATCKSAPQTTELHFVGMFKMTAIPAAATVIFQIFTTGSVVAKWTFEASSTSYTTRGFNAAGTETVTKATTFGTGAEPNKWIAFHLQLTNNAGTVDIKPEWMEMNTGVLYTQSGIGTVNFAGTPGVVQSIAVAPAIAGGAGMRFAHLISSTLAGLIFWDGANPTFAKTATGFRGESAAQRFIRICQLIGVRPVIFGQLSATLSQDAGSELMGAEPLDTGLNTLYECPAVDGGMIIEAVDQPNCLEYWTRNALENQFGTLSLTWANLSEGLKATPDDTDVANDITLSRRNGGTATATLTYGPMSIQAPPNGINDVPDGPEINNYQDSRLPALAQYLLLKKSWPTSRYPAVVIQMERADFAGNATRFLLAMRQMQGMRLIITALPTFMAPEQIDLLTRQVVEVIQGQQWKITYGCVPYGPYLGTELATTAPIVSLFSYKAASTVVNGVTQQQLNAGITNSATSFAVKTLSGVLFDTTATNIPVMIDGELMTVGSVSGTTSPQTFNSVTRGVNGFSKAHNANAAVTVYPVLKARL